MYRYSQAAWVEVDGSFFRDFIFITVDLVLTAVLLEAAQNPAWFRILGRLASHIS